MRSNYLIITFIFSLFLFSSGPVLSQVKGKKLEDLSKLPGQPEKFDTPYEDMPLKDDGKAPKNSKMWTVISDRDRNKTFLDEACTQPFSSISFMQIFVVAESKGDAIRIVEYDRAEEETIFKDEKGVRKFLPTAKDKGWIKKENMLLWKKGLVDDTTNMIQKALAVQKIDNQSDMIRLIKNRNRILDIYTVPKRDEDFLDSSKDANKFEYLFILKKDKANKMFLLSKDANLRQNSIATVILGWVPMDQVVEWDHALCLRVNFDPKAKKERETCRAAKKGKTGKTSCDVMFFTEPNCAKEYLNTGVTDCNLPFYYTDPSKRVSSTINPYFLGFPIFDKSSKGPIYNSGYVTDLVSESGALIVESDLKADWDRKWNEVMKALKTINIVFVVDGAYKNSFKTIRSALDNVDLKGESSGYVYKIGSVIYNESNTEFDINRLNANMQSVKNTFSDLGNEPSSIARGRNGSPLYAAITEATKLFENKKESNLIIVLGGVGNTPGENKQGTLQSLTEKSARQCFFQISSGDGEMYENFVDDSKFFLEGVSKALDSQDEIVKLFVNQKQYKEPILVANDKKSLAYLTNSQVTGDLYWKNPGEIFDFKELKIAIQKSINSVEQFIQQIDGHYTSNSPASQGGSNDQGSYKAFASYLTEKGIDKQDFNKLVAGKNFQLFLRAYTTSTASGLDEPLLVKCLFLSSTEFGQLYDNIKGVNGGWGGEDPRKAVSTAMKDIIIKYRGAAAANALATYRISHFTQIVTQLQSNNPTLNYKIGDIEDESKVKPADLKKIQDYFECMERKLKTLKGDIDYKLEINGDYFYWVPEDRLGCEMPK